jgi:formamidopyrimidine-DNA glycosylase
LENNEIKDIDRIGKLLIFKLKYNYKNDNTPTPLTKRGHGRKVNTPTPFAKGGNKKLFLLFHLKMTGQLIYCSKDSIIAGGHSLPKLSGCLPNNHSRALIEFADKSTLYFNDMRKFGYLQIVDEKKLWAIKESYGIEPLKDNFKLEKLSEIFKNRKISIKAVLLDQKSIAGIGNIYADEILFAARVLPNRPAYSLKKNEVAAILNAAKKIIKKAIEFKGTTFSDYADSEGNKGNFTKFLKVYGHTNQPCPVCQGLIKKIRVAGRGTHYCPVCQK